MKRFFATSQLRDRFYRPERFGLDAPLLSEIERHITPDARVLDAGAGAGDKFPYHLKGRVAEMAGADLDPRVADNPRLDRGVVSDLTRLPFDDGYFDLVFSRYVLEHIQHPETFLNEMRRVLKPGGVFIFLAPNKWHYVSLISRLTPHRFHTFFNRRRGRSDDDTFATVYRLNSKRDIRRFFSRAGFSEERLYLLECCPNYLMFSAPTFLAGVCYERLVSRTALFEAFRVNLIGVFRRNPEPI